MSYDSASDVLRARRQGSRSAANSSISSNTTSTSDKLTGAALRTFHALGLWLSTHQISALLLCCLVMCSLLCPALVLYFLPTGALSLEALSLSPASRARIEMPWEMEPLRRQGLITSKEPVCWDRLSAYYAARELPAPLIRVEQIFISTTSARRQRGPGALGKSTLLRAARIQRELERRLLEGEIEGMTCVLGPRAPDGRRRCAVVSPVEWWQSEAALVDDEDVHKTLATNPGMLQLSNGTILGSTGPALPITSGNSLIGVGRDRQGYIRRARRLALTFFLEDAYRAHHAPTSTLGLVGSHEETFADSKARIAWRNAVKDVVNGRNWPRSSDDHVRKAKLGEIDEMKGAPHRVILKFLPWLSVTPNPRFLEGVIFSIGYVLVGVYVYLAIRPLAQVNSKAGLLLTGLVELTSSGVMSLSICWLMGWDIDLIPWNLLLFLVLACGVDNMLLLANAVAATNMDLPVPERVATALTSFGPPTTLTLCFELLLAATLDLLVDVAIIRQILCFIMVILVVNFFLEMIFFATILSIDVQRLELADLLNQQKYRSTGASSATPSEFSADNENGFHVTSPDGPSFTVRALRSYFRQRTTRGITFVVLASFDTLLMILYGPDHFLPAFCSETALSPQRPLLAPSLSAEVSRSLLRGQRDRHRMSSALVAGAGEAFWHLLNPFNASSVHIYVEPPVAVQLYDDGLAAPESLQGHAISEASVLGKVAVIVVPILVTTAMLYILLRYLLKDVDLLEADRSDRLYPARKSSKSRRGNAPRLRSTRIKHAGAADIELAASSADAVATWCALSSQVIVWRRPHELSSTTSIVLNLPLSANLPSLAALALDTPASGFAQFCAAADNDGRIHIWALEQRLPVHFTQLDVEESATSRQSTSFEQLDRCLFLSPIRLAHDGSGFVSLHTGGALTVWNPYHRQVAVVVPPSASRPTSPPTDPVTSAAGVRHMILRDADTCVLARLDSSTGSVRILSPAHGDPMQPWTTKLDQQLLDPSSGTITTLALGRIRLPQPPVLLSSATDSSTQFQDALFVGASHGELSLHTLPGAGDESKHLALDTLDGPIRQIRVTPTKTSSARPIDQELCSICGNQLSGAGAIVASSTKTQLHSVRLSFTRNDSESEGCTCIAGWVGPARSRTSSEELLRDDVPHDRAMHEVRTPRKSRGVERAVSGARNGQAGQATSSSASSQASSLVSVLSRLQVRDLISTAVDDRGGWDLIDGVLLGLHRVKNTASENVGASGMQWQVWSAMTRLKSHSIGRTSLDVLLANANVHNAVEPDDANEGAQASAMSTLRRRRVINGSESSRLGKRGEASTAPQLRFEFVDDLPFTRARPVMSALAGSALAVGLGNQLVLLSPTVQSRVQVNESWNGKAGLLPPDGRMKRL